MEDVRQIIVNDVAFEDADKFDLLNKVNDITNEADFRNLAILIAERLGRGEWAEYTEIASSLVRKAGLFLYMQEGQSGGKDELAHELHRSPSGRDSYMHRAQYQVLQRLLSGDSLILSAPTSFGKSFIIDELILSGQYANVLIVVPTIALIDETRRRIAGLGTDFNIVCFTNQAIYEKNIFILTQERALEMQNDIYNLDLLVIDEFYKMDSSISKDGGERSSLLNVCYRLFEAKAKQVYLLGPYISQVAGYETSKHKPEIVICTDNTTYIEYIPLTGDKNDNLVKVIELEETNVMVYCNSPAEISKVYRHLAANMDVYSLDKVNEDFATWIDENVCSDWYVAEALSMGIGIHHAQMPRFVAQEMVRRFNNGSLRVLLCTSTIIEGVNTAAKAVYIYSKKRGNYNYDQFTFRNIAGRAGRTFKHFSGRVYHFDTPESTEDIVVTDQIGTDSDYVEPNILSLLDESGLSTKQTDKLTEYRESSSLPVELLKDNYFIPSDLQEKVVEKIRNGIYRQLGNINEQRLVALQMKLVFMALAELGLNVQSIGQASTPMNSITRMNIFVNAYMMEGIEGLARSYNKDRTLSDKSIEFAFDFVRNSMTFRMPRYIRALDRLQKYALSNPGNLEPFANSLEFMYLPPAYVQLDELGLPVSVSKKLGLPTDSIDEALSAISSSEASDALDDFEKEVLVQFKSSA